MFMQARLKAIRKVKLIFVFWIMLLDCRGLFGQDEHIDLAKNEAESFSLEAMFAFEEYRMFAEISVEASPDSELLFTSKATMEILQTSEYRVESFRNFPKIFSDDRLVRSTEKGGFILGGPFSRAENWERLVVDGNAYEMLDELGRQKSPNFAQPIGLAELSLATACMQPYDWPLHGPTSFNPRFSERNFHKTTFGKDRVCVFAARKDGLLESHWLKPSDNVMGVRTVTFKNGSVIGSRLYVYRKPIDIKTYDLKKGWPMVTTETTWVEQDGSSVPKTVVSVIRPNVGSDESLLLVANIKLFSTGDAQFKEKKNKISLLVDTANKPK